MEQGAFAFTSHLSRAKSAQLYHSRGQAVSDAHSGGKFLHSGDYHTTTATAKTKDARAAGGGSGVSGSRNKHAVEAGSGPFHVSDCADCAAARGALSTSAPLLVPDHSCCLLQAYS